MVPNVGRPVRSSPPADSSGWGPTLYQQPRAARNLAQTPWELITAGSEIRSTSQPRSPRCLPRRAIFADVCLYSGRDGLCAARLIIFNPSTKEKNGTARRPSLSRNEREFLSSLRATANGLFDSKTACPGRFSFDGNFSE